MSASSLRSHDEPAMADAKTTSRHQRSPELHLKRRVGIDLLGIQRGRSGGVETYIRELLRELPKDSELDILLFTSHANHQSFAEYDNVERVLCPVRGTRLVRRVVFEQLRLSGVARKHGCDLLYCPGYLSPIFPRLPTVVAIHDMNFRDIPASFSRTRRWLQECVIPGASRRASAVITMSEFSRRRILDELKLSPAKVHAIHLAARTFAAAAPQIPAVTRWRLPKNFIISVSGASPPHKNIARLCRAFTRARASFNAPWELWCIGPPSEMMASLRIVGESDGIRFPGYVEDRELAALYHHAGGFVLPSMYEGFGLPALEAMCAGLPVLCSNTASLPEVVGKAALLFDPYSEQSIANALVQFVNDDDLRTRLIMDGTNNLKRFSWSKCAAATAGVFKSVVSARSQGCG